MDMYLGMLNDTENDRQCSRHREIEYGCHSRTVYLPIIIGIILQDVEPSERNGDITTFSVTTDNVSCICLSLKNACLIMWRPS